ncbi:MAG: hypothetical protein ACK5MD_06715 [Flavobacteriales bacterium]
MKFLLGIFLSVLFMPTGCNVNTVHKNEDSEKEKVELVLNQFYQFIEKEEYDKTTSFLSPNFYKYTSKEEYLNFRSSL